MTDWFHAFQDRPHGFIAMMERSETLDQLDEVFTLVVEKLFIRDGDEPLRHRFLSIMQTSHAQAQSLQAHMTKLRMVMNQIMDERIIRAQRHAAEKANSERRKASSS